MSAANVAPVAAAAAAEIAADFQAAIFFDNARDHIDQVNQSCPKNVLAVKVAESVGIFYDENGRKVPYPVIPFDSTPFISYLATIGPNVYQRFLASCNYVADSFDQISGISATDIETGQGWLRDTTGVASRAALFDWDRTLTKFEGNYDLKHPMIAPYLERFYAAEPAQSYETIINDAVIYFCGGAERLASLRAFMRQLSDAGVSIFVLTNNGNCGLEFYNDLTRAFFQDIPFAGAICSRHVKNPRTLRTGDKGVALVIRPRFKAICTRYGGARKKRGSTKKRRASRHKRR